MEVCHTIEVLKRQGLKKRAIAWQVGISHNTVKRYWHNQAPPSISGGHWPRG